MTSPAGVARVATTLVIGPGAAARERAIFDRLRQADPDGASILHHGLADSAGAASGSIGLQAVVLEGIASGSSPLDTLPPHVHLARIAPGCLCCTGNLVLRVTLNRMLRQRPERLYIGVADSEHLDQLRSWLQSAPYDQLLTLTSDLQA